MNLVLLFLITAIIAWKSIYTVKLIVKFTIEKNNKEKYINIVLFNVYIIYFYFLYKVATNSLESPVEGPLWLILIFIFLIFGNLCYDFKNGKKR
ncbi:hypothetical protein JW813_11805 [Clostridium botulinum]|uniref:hypothetical protein n=1 Tax=Clostridium botulinum TaxID=1491 RepID=UPI0021AE7FD1|nr:hypothetical protein [Clostridium botulinum]UZP02398.1 hypothetical protein JW813_11805 [Clostridium botulinum]UZP05757.1 hypothetical protein JYA71_12075 [Clostridium botulinum]UZP09138.1 hypothetical protein JYA74_11800 [Clostridium botulinum]